MKIPKELIKEYVKVRNSQTQLTSWKALNLCLPMYSMKCFSARCDFIAILIMENKKCVIC